MIIREKRKHKRLVVVAGMMLLFAGAIKQPSLTAYAAEGQTTQATSQSTRWEGQGDAWRVRTQDGSGYITNDWFQDLDGSWYMLGADGYMFSGLITDQSTGKSYLLNTEHDGTYGRMIATDGVHMVNGQAIYLTFNQNHDGTYGAITNGLSELRNTGIKQVTKNDAGMVVEGSQGTQGSATQTQGTGQGTTQTSNSTGEFCEGWMNKSYDEMTQAERDRYEEIMIGGSVVHPSGTTPVDINWG